MNTRNGYEKWKCKILCFLEEVNINQDYCQEVKNINCQDVRINRIQVIAHGKKNLN